MGISVRGDVSPPQVALWVVIGLAEDQPPGRPFTSLIPVFAQVGPEPRPGGHLTSSYHLHKLIFNWKKLNFILKFS